MNAMTLLNQRQSTALLKSPAPEAEELDKIITAGMRVPDHAGLKPWHFKVVSEGGLQKLSELFVDSSASTPNANLEKIAKMPFRAPMIIIVSTDYSTHEKVPMHEQLITAGCCVHAMQMACVALGFGAMWRTGDLATNKKVKEGLGIKEPNDIVGFLYIGTACKEERIKPIRKPDDKVSFWQ